MSTDVTAEDIEKLLKHFAKYVYRAVNNDPVYLEAMANCLELVKMDYSFITIGNHQGELCDHYPTQIIVLENEITNFNGNGGLPRTSDTIYEHNYEKRNLRESIIKARIARCRTRFPVPVILYKGRHICRSSTVAGGTEVYYRSNIEYIVGQPEPDDDHGQVPEELSLGITPGSPSIPEVPEDISQTVDMGVFDSVRHADISYLKSLNIKTIVDLMVEHKKVKFHMYVTSSEKVDKQERYKDFSIIALPYPGCEFFQLYRKNDYNGQGLVFDWNQSYVDAELSIPQELTNSVRINFANYKKWDLINLTKNYMKLLIRLIQDSTSGILIHCISGWDRTPLFVSLLRISLWADGVVHQKLSATQMLYFTLAYDWVLFGHNLSDRIDKGEEIMHFCFFMLKYLEGEDFSVLSLSNKLKTKPSLTNILEAAKSDDCPLDPLLVEDVHGSNVSVNSSGSSSSIKDQEISYPSSQNSEESINGNSPLFSETSSPPPIRSRPYSPNQRHTSPIAVPTQMRRQRTDSSSSISSGWAFVSRTGSLRSDSSEINMGSKTDLLSDEDITIMRRKRLSEIRGTFYSHYGRAVGSRMRGYEPKRGVISCLAESVGLL